MTNRFRRGIANILAMAIACGSLFISCTSEDTLPPASGASGDIYLVMDSTQWKGRPGRLMDSILRKEMVGLPRAEPIFHMLWIDPRKLNYVLKQRRNLIFVLSLDKNTVGSNRIKGQFSKTALEQIKAGSNKFNVTKKNVFAKGQEVLYLFAKTENELLDVIRKNSDRMVTYFNASETRRLQSALFRGNAPLKLAKMMQETYGCTLKIPYGYKVADKTNDFLWVRQINPYVDKDIFIARQKYNSETQFEKENLIAFRNRVCRKYLFEDPERISTYLTTETDVEHKPVLIEERSFNGHFAVEMRGLWKTNNLTMGGPFVGYALANQASGYFYYIEGFTYSPQKKQREVIRELETILSTFKFSGATDHQASFLHR